MGSGDGPGCDDILFDLGYVDNLETCLTKKHPAFMPWTQGCPFGDFNHNRPRRLSLSENS